MVWSAKDKTLHGLNADPLADTRPFASGQRLARHQCHEIIDERNIAFGGAQLVMKLPRGWVAGSDSRKDGHAAGR